MMIFVIIIHVIVCIGLIGIVLIQRGRGSGLVESFAGVESMFGTKTSAFLTRATAVLSTMFFLTCLTLAVLSIRQSRSLIKNIKVKDKVEQPVQESSKPVTNTTSTQAQTPKKEEAAPSLTTAVEQKKTPEAPKTE